MKLLRLVLQGFKSFASRTEISFAEGITMIVGPNGCGKSNISDAVRWVLGEQNVRNLRGQKTEDIIFAGSASRKAKNGAEVQLVLDNADRLASPRYGGGVGHAAGPAERRQRFLYQRPVVPPEGHSGSVRRDGARTGFARHHRAEPGGSGPVRPSGRTAAHFRRGGGHQPVPPAQGRGARQAPPHGREYGPCEGSHGGPGRADGAHGGSGGKSPEVRRARAGAAGGRGHGLAPEAHVGAAHARAV